MYDKEKFAKKGIKMDFAGPGGMANYKEFLYKNQLSPEQLSRSKYLEIVALDDPIALSAIAPVLAEYGTKAIKHLYNYWSSSPNPSFSGLWGYIKNLFTDSS